MPDARPIAVGAAGNAGRSVTRCAHHPFPGHASFLIATPHNHLPYARDVLQTKALIAWGAWSADWVRLMALLFYALTIQWKCPSWPPSGWMTPPAGQ